jgi:hypothetical protein
MTMRNEMKKRKVVDGKTKQKYSFLVGVTFNCEGEAPILHN